MKAVARSARPASANSLQARRAPAGHVSQAHERQANAAAHGFLHGETGLQRLLTPVSAAAFDARHSPGSALPTALRSDLEASFNADLSAVRIHNDGLAAATATSLGALAFASGTHVYFAANQFRPQAMPGRALIAHEIAHVLQQTGVAAYAGTLAARPVTGLGAVQCKNGGTDAQETTADDEQEIKKQTAIFGQLAHDYRGGKGPSGDKELDSTIEKVSTLTGGRVGVMRPPASFGDPLKLAADRNEFAGLKSAKAKSFVFECLKLLGYFSQAARILETDTKFEIRVITSLKDFANFLVDSPDFGRKWLSRFLSHKEFSKFWPSTIAKGWRNFFLNPGHVDPVDPALRARSEAALDEAKKGHGKTPPSLRGEHYYVLWTFIAKLDDERSQQAVALNDRLLRMHARITLMELLVLEMPRLRTLALKQSEAADASGADRTVAMQQIAAIDEVLPFWQKALEDYSTYVATFAGFSTASLALEKTASKFPDATPIAPMLEPLRGQLVNATTALLEPKTQTRPDSAGGTIDVVVLPEPDEYRQRLDAFVEALTKQTLRMKRGGEQKTFVAHATRLLVDEAESRKPDKSKMLLLAVFEFAMNDLIFAANRYDVAKDRLASSFEDTRAAHRFHFARHVVALARWLRWDDLRAAASAVLIGAEDKSVAAEDRKSVLWLVSDWEAEERMPVGRMGQDFWSKLDEPVLEESPLTVRHLVEWFRYDHSKRLRQTLENLLRDEDFLTKDTQFSLDPVKRLRHSKKDVERSMAPTAQAELAITDEDVTSLAITQPQRFFVRDWEVRVPPDAALDWNKLIRTHTKTLKQIERRAAGGSIFPSDLTQGVFGWALPSLDGLVTFMKNIPAIAQLARDKNLPGADWLAQLAPSRATESDFTTADVKRVQLKAEDWVKLNDVLLKWLHAFREQEEKQLPDLWRRTAILYRRWNTMVIRERIDYYAKYTTVTGGPIGESGKETNERLAIPEKVVDLYFRFESNVRSMLQDAEDPDAAAETQTALLVFGMAPSLLDVDPGLIDGYFKRHLYAMFAFAIDFAEDEGKLQRLRSGTGSPDEVNAIVFSKSRLASTVKAMREMMARFDEELEESQEDSGYCSEDGAAIHPNDSHFPNLIEASEKTDPTKQWRLHKTLGADRRIDEESGDAYQLYKVRRKFWFYPQAGISTARGLRKSAGGPTRPAKIIYIDDDGNRQVVSAPDQQPAMKEVLLFTMKINNQLVPYHASDVEDLTAISDTFMWRSFQLGMAETAQLIQTFAEYMELVVTVLFPELALPEFVARIAAMFLSGEFDDLIFQLKHDPVGLAKQLVSDFRDKLFDSSAIWEFILIGSQHSPWATLHSLLPKRDRKVQPEPTTKFGKVVAALRSLGSRFADGLHRFHEYTQPPLRSVQGRIGMHPTLVWFLHRAAHLGEAAFDLIPFDKLEEARKGDGPAVLSEFASVLGGEVGGIEEEMSARMVELLEGIRRFELPGALLDLQVAAEIIIDYLLKMFGARGKVARMALELAPVPSEWAGRGGPGISRAMDVITYEIKKLWEDSVVDPNKYWRDDVLPLIGDKFREVRDELVKGLYAMINKTLGVIGLHRRLEPPDSGKLPETKVEPDTLTDEAEASIGPASPPPTRRPFALPAAAGQPLPAQQRVGFESAIGADFSHVRVHADAAEATSSIGADAVTSGSHVYLRPGIAPRSTAGTRLLSHELTHVVQQTGALDRTAVGHRHPTVGRPGLGIRHIGARERVADDVAAHVARGDRVPASLRGGLGGAQGIQPSMTENVVEGVLGLLTHDTKPQDFTHDLEQGEPPGWADAQSLAGAVFSRLKAVEKLDFPDFLKGTAAGRDVPTEVVSYLKSDGDLKGKELEKIAALAQKPIRKKKKDDPDTEFSPKLFLQLLANYLYADRHVAVRITADANLKGVDKIEITNLNLAKVHGNTNLWRMATKESFEGHPGLASLDKVQADMRQRLLAMQVQPSIWDKSRYRFAQWLIDEYVAEVKARERAKVGDVPKVVDYVNTESGSGEGLAVSTHGVLTKRGIGAFGRESHHTTQYLLAEFFGNEKDSTQKAFPPPLSDFQGAGIVTKGDEVTRIDGVGGSIDIAPLNPDSGRGANMPAILLSARCHQRGELHVLREPRWTDDNQQTKEMRGTPTQGLAIENAFNSAISVPALRPRDASAEKRTRLRAQIAADPTGARQQYYSAAISTYRWMRKRMLPQLKQALLTEEKAYYRGIAALNHSEGEDLASAYRLEDHHLLHVYSVAEKNNDSVMGGFQWKA